MYNLHKAVMHIQNNLLSSFGRYDQDEQLFNAPAWYSMTMLFQVLLSKHLPTPPCRTSLCSTERLSHKQHHSSNIAAPHAMRYARFCSSSTRTSTRSI